MVIRNVLINASEYAQTEGNKVHVTVLLHFVKVSQHFYNTIVMLKLQQSNQSRLMHLHESSHWYLQVKLLHSHYDLMQLFDINAQYVLRAKMVNDGINLGDCDGLALCDRIRYGVFFTVQYV